MYCLGSSTPSILVIRRMYALVGLWTIVVLLWLLGLSLFLGFGLFREGGPQIFFVGHKCYEMGLLGLRAHYCVLGQG